MKMKLNYIKILLVIGLVITSYFLYTSYKNYTYSKDLKNAYSKYREVQKKCDVVGTTQNYIYLKRNKDDYSFRKGLSDSKWKLTNINTKEEYTFVTGEDGYGGVVGLENGIYTLEEISVPNDEKITKCTKQIIFDKGNSSYEFKIGSSSRNNLIYIRTIDQEGKIVKNITYEIYDSTYKLKETFQSESGGMIYSNISTGTYYVRNVEYDLYYKVDVKSCEESDVQFIIRR